MSKICIFCGHEYEDNEPKCPFCADRIDSADKVRNRKLRSNFSFGPALSFGGNSRSKAIIIIIAIILVLALIAGVFLITGKAFSRKSMPATADMENEMTLGYRCPDFKGMTIDEVKEHELYKDNILTFEFEYTYNEEYPIGQVCGQSLERNSSFSGFNTSYEMCNKGDKIILYISNEIEIPDVTGLDRDSAIEELHAKELTTFNVIEIPNDEIEAGHVIRTEPSAWQIVSSDTIVTIYVSSGRATRYVRVPDVVYLQENDAIRSILDCGLMYAISYYPSEDYFENVIFYQDIPGGTEVEENTIITIYASTGAP